MFDRDEIAYNVETCEDAQYEAWLEHMSEGD